MVMIGVDYHPSDQYIAFVDIETGECGERRLNHSDKEAEKFYSGTGGTRSKRARRDGGHGLLTLVRAVAGGIGYRGMDRRCGGD